MSVGKKYCKILCYGDSNTYGYDARSPFGDRFPGEYCWPDILGKTLDAETVNCGMNGRCVPGSDYSIRTELASVKRHTPCDMVIVMLGSNDILNGLYSADEIAARMSVFLSAFMQEVPGADFLLIAPPEIDLTAQMKKQSVRLSLCYHKLAKELGIFFADAAIWQLPVAWDGVHLTLNGHRLFAEKTAELITGLSV